jgi:hypothetical protein
MAMKRLFVLAPLIGFAAPAHATGGYLCRTAGPLPIEVSVGFGHVPGAPLISTRLIDAGRLVPTTSAQWWLDDSDLRLLLISPSAEREELLLRARRNGFHYDGTIRRDGKRRWVRCREG